MVNQIPEQNSVLLRRELKRKSFPLRVGPPTQDDINRMEIADDLDRIFRAAEKPLPLKRL